MRAALLLLTVAACNQPPVVEITSPAAEELITDHGTVAVVVHATDEDLADLTLLLDGAATDTVIDETTFPADGDCGDGCDVTLYWRGDEAREGARTLTVIATDEHDETGTADLALTFEDTPTATFANPVSPDQLGVGMMNVRIAIQDRGDLTGEMLVDGEPVDAMLFGDCRFGCSFELPWDVSAISGEHVIDVTITDQDGRAATATQAVMLGDIPFVDAIEVTGEVDTLGFGDLEIEVHLSDADTGAFIGCTGEDQGLDAVDENDTRYDVLGVFVDSTGARLSGAALAGRNLIVRVMEDDNFACPGALDLISDDEVGVSAPVPAADLPGHAPMTFGGVTALELDLGRPY